MTETGASAPARRQNPRWLWGGLLVSLALNLLLIGLIAGGAWRRFRVDDFSSGTAQAARFVHRLPSERREQIRSAVREQLDRLRELRRAARVVRDGATKALAAEPFDLAAYTAAQDRLVAADAEIRAQGAKILTATANLLSTEERRALAQRMSRYEQWRDRRGGRRDRADEAAPQGPAEKRSP